MLPRGGDQVVPPLNKSPRTPLKLILDNVSALSEVPLCLLFIVFTLSEPFKQSYTIYSLS